MINLKMQVFPSVFLMIMLGVPVVPFKTGAPPGACSEMTPKHGDNFPQSTAMPYSVTFTITSIEGGKYVPLTLKGSGSDTFKGFLVKAVDSKNEIVGTFDVSTSSRLAKTINCSGGTSNAVTHVDPSGKNEVTVNWIAPKDFSGDVTFLYTIVKDFKTYWVMKRSNSLEVYPGKDPMTSTVPSAVTTPKGGTGAAVNYLGSFMLVMLPVIINFGKYFTE